MDQDQELACDACGEELAACVCDDDDAFETHKDVEDDGADDDVDSQEGDYEHKVLVSGMFSVFLS